MNIFLTGATGYIGGSLVRRLVADGHSVRALHRGNSQADDVAGLGAEPVLADLDDGDTLAREACRADAVINAADSDHAGAVEALVDALAGSGKPLIHTSGSSIVGDASNGEYSPMVYSEDAVEPGSGWEPTDDKAARVGIDRAVLAGADRDVRSVVLCNSLIYGTGQGIKPDSVQLPRLIRQARASGVTRHVGPGRNVWSNVHIEDMCELYIRALADAPAGSFYFVENGEASYRTMCEAISDALGLGEPQPWSVEEAVAEWGYEVAVYALGSNSRVRARRARAELGWAPTHASVTDWIRAEVSPELWVSEDR
ncbi:NAD-dependent epimerase/dehydratase family protein [Phytoactinopolyspora halotolerans]|uniref:NAD-dependent epimerase/dehydratase family protein n=1 Tax=Phytoactinopolyspora halotolerans TaxID=1981512 RepID=A0A6L9SEN5_9ACTN|nr:NAD-dependent epimerase/dehydratase family protein [Phytoactinopolyspora halotolerans]NEE03696.1 NAD-dependent epimerase/dehydratase family protein [Phytoactinopolyspora halotolerans]